ncbi:MAG: diguanylate cyclase/phosphodiesterase [bacterium]|nr:diguanylate cyclase/phosphodiesterase [bacterium]
MRPQRSSDARNERTGADAAHATRVLLVDDDAQLGRAYERILRSAGFVVERAADGALAIDAVTKRGFDVVLSDIDMPGVNGIGLLRAIRGHDLDLPVVLVTGSPAVETAIAAVELGALRYLIKPIAAAELVDVVRRAAQLRRMASLKRQALGLLEDDRFQIGDRAGVEAVFARALDSLWMAYQPIVAWSQRRTFALEALVRSGEPAMAGPGAIFDAAERLDRLVDVGRRIRASVAATAPGMGDTTLFVNLHPRDLLDDELYSPAAPLSAVASRVVLEITERASLDHVLDVRARIAALRALGYRIAVDDLGAGYAGLTSFAQLEPEVAKVDMSLVRGIDAHPTKQKLVRSLVALCAELKLLLVVEGVETAAERDTLIELGCELMQGYLFARPSPTPPLVAW